MAKSSTEIFARLTALGCSVEDALEDTYMGNEALYLKQIIRLAGSETPQRLLAAVAAGNVGESFEAAHELKGLYATMGLNSLYEECCVIVEQTRGEAGSLDGVAEKAAALVEHHASMLQDAKDCEGM